MPEREQFYQEVVARGHSDANKADILSFNKEFFHDPDKTRLASIEREKSPEEQAVIEIVRDYGDRFAEALGLSAFPVSQDHFHIIRSQDWPDDINGKGEFNLSSQQLIIREPASLLALAHTAYHEYMHVKSYGVAQLAIPNDEAIPYRVGFGIYSRDGQYVYFRLLNEAITEEITRSFIYEVRQHESLFQEEAAITEELRLREGDLQAFNEPVFNPDVYFASEVRLANGNVKLYAESYSYPAERQSLNILIDKIASRNSISNSRCEDIYWMFVRGTMTGNILPIGRLIDGTFGSGTFRHIGEAVDGDELLTYVERL